MKTMLLLAIGLGISGMASCGSNDSSDCGSETNPTILTVTDRTPVMGTSVTNKSIAHAFTVKEAPIMFSSLPVGLPSPQHTAGTPTPSPLTWMGQASGKDLVWSTTIDAWATAPSHVEMAPIGGWKSDSGCYYKLPSPLFSYDLTP